MAKYMMLCFLRPLYTVECLPRAMGSYILSATTQHSVREQNTLFYILIIWFRIPLAAQVTLRGALVLVHPAGVPLACTAVFGHSSAPPVVVCCPFKRHRQLLAVLQAWLHKHLRRAMLQAKVWDMQP